MALKRARSVFAALVFAASAAYVLANFQSFDVEGKRYQPLNLPPITEAEVQEELASAIEAHNNKLEYVLNYELDSSEKVPEIEDPFSLAVIRRAVEDRLLSPFERRQLSQKEINIRVHAHFKKNAPTIQTARDNLERKRQTEASAHQSSYGLYWPYALAIIIAILVVPVSSVFISWWVATVPIWAFLKWLSASEIT